METLDWLKAIVKNAQDGRVGVVAQRLEDRDKPSDNLSFVFVEYDGTAVWEKTPTALLEIVGHIRPRVHPDCFGNNGTDCRFRCNGTCYRYTGQEAKEKSRRPVAMYPACIIDQTQAVSGKKSRKKGG